MNRIHDDVLLRTAFGEAAPEEARRVEEAAQRDPEVRRRLDSYRVTSGDLARIAATSVPDDQLSKERLRDAILGGGLKPAPKVAWWNWFAAPAAALALGALATIWLHSPSVSPVEPRLVADGSLTDRPTAPIFDARPAPSVPAKPVQKAAVATADANSAPPAPKARRRTPAPTRPSPANHGLLAMSDTGEDSGPIVSPVSTPPTVDEDEPTRKEAPTPAASTARPEPGPIVLMEPPATQPDATVPPATEVSGASVWVGG
jgi:hypothetical protein